MLNDVPMVRLLILAALSLLLTKTVNGQEKQSRLALLVGINDYAAPEISDLQGCVNDVLDMQQLLLSKFEFPETNVLVLTEKQATHAGIVEAIQTHLIAQAAKDAIVVFHFSGHGSQMTDNSGDEPDDETIVPYDSRMGEVFDISDDELRGLLGQLSDITPNVTFILDSCHSGTAVRGAGRVRAAPRDERRPPRAPDYAVSAPVAKGDQDDALEGRRYVLIAGCRDKESSYEMLADGQRRGALSYFLTSEIRRQPADSITYRDLMDQVMAKVNGRYLSQHPQLEGAGLDQFLFGDKSSIPEAYLKAHPQLGQVRLEGGAVHGLTKGSEFNVFPPGTKTFDDETKVLARIKLTNVEPYQSVGDLLERWKDAVVPEASRAVEVTHVYERAQTVPVYVAMAKGRKSLAGFERRLRTELAEYAGFLLVDDESAGQLFVYGRDDGRIEILGHAGMFHQATVKAADRDAVERVREQLQHWAKWSNVLHLENPHSKLSIEFSVDLPAEAPKRDGVAPADATRLTLQHEDGIRFTVRNAGDRDVYFVLLDLSSDGQISQIYPGEGPGERLAAGKEWTGETTVYVPEGRKQITDVYKVIAADEPVDLRFLMLPGAPRGPLESLLASRTLMEARQARPLLARDGRWGATLRVVDVVKDK